MARGERQAFPRSHIMRPGTDRSHPRVGILRLSDHPFRSLTSLYQEHGVRKGEQTRQEIIRKAAPIFNQKGYSGTALSDLMRATGLGKGGIYGHFESKQELARDAFEHAWKLAMETHFKGTQEIPNTVDRLIQVVRNFRDRRVGLVPGGGPLLNTAHHFEPGDSPFRGESPDCP